MKKYYRYLFILHLFMGITAMIGGLPVVIDPSGKNMGVPLEMLEGSPFKDFLIPGLFLLIVNGIGNIIISLFAYKKHRLLAYLSGSFGVIMISWIVIQCIIIDSINIAHIIYFTLGLITSIIALLLAIKQNLFPLNLIFKK